jgi:hypothetical protein
MPINAPPRAYAFCGGEQEYYWYLDPNFPLIVITHDPNVPFLEDCCELMKNYLKQLKIYKHYIFLNLKLKNILYNYTI